MARKPGPGRCVHCLGWFDKRNWDHVFPRSWYPDSTLPNVEKWQIPTCKSCNTQYGKIEEDLFLRLALCLDPKKMASSGIAKRALRSVDPASGRNQKDKRMRTQRREQLWREIGRGDQVTREMLYPGFKGVADLPAAQQLTIRIPVVNVNRLVEKLVRGIFYCEGQTYIEWPYEIRAYAVEEEGAAQTVALLDRFGTRYARAPGIVIDRAVAPEDGISALFRIEVWQQWVIYASVTHPGVEALYLTTERDDA